MEDTGWAAEGFFSPSKAKLAQAQAREWSFVDAWLSKKYVSGRVPPYERNDDTLQALLSLISLNEKADERRSIVERVEKTALQHHAKQRQLQQESGDVLHQSIIEGLDQRGLDALDSLAQSSLVLNVPIKRGMSELLSAAIGLQVQAFESQHVERCAVDQVRALTLEHERLQKQLTDMQNGPHQLPPTLAEDTVQWTKGVKHLRAKIGDYDERLSATRPTSALLVALDESRQMMSQNENLRRQLSDIEDELDAHETILQQGQRPDILLSQARSELAALQANMEATRKAHG